MSEDDRRFPSQVAERFQIRMPDGLRDALRIAAASNNRSMNSEIVARLEGSLSEVHGVDFRVEDLLEVTLAADLLGKAVAGLMDDDRRAEEFRKARLFEGLGRLEGAAKRARRAIWLTEFDRSEELQREFITRESYAAYQEHFQPNAFGVDWRKDASRRALENLQESVRRLSSSASDPSEK